MQIHDRLRIFREDSKKTQREMAAALDVSFRSYFNYETGKTAINSDIMVKLADLGADVLYIVTGNKTPLDNITSHERQFIDIYRELPESIRKNFFEIINYMREINN